MKSTELQKMHKEKSDLSHSLIKEVYQIEKDFIEDYVDEGIVKEGQCLSITIRGITYELWRYDATITNIHPECVFKDITTMEEMIQMLADKKIAERCATQAFMAYEYIKNK